MAAETATAAVTVKAARTKPVRGRRSLEAVHNQRENRKAAKRSKQKPGKHWTDRQQREREAAARMVRRFFPVDVPHLIVLDYRYWQARRCGWDPLCKMLWDGTGDPRETSAWRWWTGLHYESRDELVRTSGHRLTRVNG